MLPELAILLGGHPTIVPALLSRPRHHSPLDFILQVQRLVLAALSTAECGWVCELDFDFPLLLRVQQSTH